MFQSWYATCPRGAEVALQAELSELGAKGIRPGVGGVRFTGERELALRGCIWLRTALRLLEPVGEIPAPDAQALYEGVRGLPWRQLIAQGQTLAVSASGSAPGLTHSHFVELKIKDAICDTLREALGTRPDVDTRSPDVRVVAHLYDRKLSLGLDLAGDLLSNRGYRVQTVEAPLREALAAAVVLLSGWDRKLPVHDPVCGSGTLAIEAALLGGGRAPNLERRFACESWPRTAQSDRATLERLRAEARERARQLEQPLVLASDRDREAVAATQANAQAAGVRVRVTQADARTISPLGTEGQLLLNVPYGERLEAGGKKQLKSFYHLLGQALSKLPGHRAAILSSSEDFEGAFGVRPIDRPAVLWNGPLRCSLYKYQF